MVLGALCALIGIEPDLEVVAQAPSGSEALAAALSLRPDVVVTDIEMPGLSGLELTNELRRRGSGARVIILTTFARPGYLRRALDAGASGYLLKDAPSHRLADAIRLVHGGGRAVDAELDLSEGTVRNYLSEAINKIGARNRIEAARIARAKGWL